MLGSQGIAGVIAVGIITIVFIAGSKIRKKKAGCTMCTGMSLLPATPQCGRGVTFVAVRTIWVNLPQHHKQSQGISGVIASVIIVVVVGGSMIRRKKAERAPSQESSLAHRQQKQKKEGRSSTVHR